MIINKIKFLTKSGTTLIEVLLYSILVAFFVLLLTYYVSSISSGKVRNDAQAEVTDNAQIALGEIEIALRNAREIITPANKGDTSSWLTIIMPDTSEKTFDISNGILRIKEGASDPVALTSTKTVVENLTFTNLSRTSTQGNIRIQMQIKHLNPSNDSEFNANTTIDSSVTLRPN